MAVFKLKRSEALAERVVKLCWNERKQCVQ
jgi:hypothetical protein